MGERVFKKDKGLFGGLFGVCKAKEMVDRLVLSYPVASKENSFLQYSLENRRMERTVSQKAKRIRKKPNLQIKKVVIRSKEAPFDLISSFQNKTTKQDYNFLNKTQDRFKYTNHFESLFDKQEKHEKTFFGRKTSDYTEDDLSQAIQDESLGISKLL